MYLEQDNSTKYQVVINGVPYGTPQPSKHLAESILAKLVPEQQQLAEIRLITTDGKEVLFG